MPPKSSTLTTLRGPTSLPEPAPPAPTRGIAAPLREGGWRRRLAIACGVLAAFIWSELYPGDLRQAGQAYRRNDLRRALRIAEAHLDRRPSRRSAALLAARCLSRLGQPDRAEDFYRKARPLDVEDLHLRASALVLAHRREPAIRAYREILD